MIDGGKRSLRVSRASYHGVCLDEQEILLQIRRKVWTGYRCNTHMPAVTHSQTHIYEHVCTMHTHAHTHVLAHTCTSTQTYKYTLT